MATGKPRFYWDAAPIIAWITDEAREDPSEMDGLAEVVELVERRKAILMTSVLWRVEVLDFTLKEKQKKKLEEVFSYRLIEELDIDSRVMDLAREIRQFHMKEASKSSKAVLKNIRVPDAIHLASAVHYEATEFHTFDGKKAKGGTAGLLTLDGNVAGRKLRVCAPHAEQIRLQFRSAADEDDDIIDADE